MNKTLTETLFTSYKAGEKRISELSPKQKTTLEKSWDVEHAYYSSTLEGSKLDRKEFEEIAKKID